MATCVFCGIAAKKIPADVVYEDDDLVAFHDIQPKYAVHILLVPKAHLSSVAAAQPQHDALIGRMLRIGARLAAERGMTDSGFRLLTNTGPHAGQAVDHLHIHLLGGQRLRPI